MFTHAPLFSNTTLLYLVLCDTVSILVNGLTVLFTSCFGVILVNSQEMLYS